MPRPSGSSRPSGRRPSRGSRPGGKPAGKPGSKPGGKPGSKSGRGRVTGPTKPRRPDPRIPPGQMRLQKYLAACGLGSRRACEELITQGRITIDGQTATLGANVDPSRQTVTYDGDRLRLQPRRYFLLNKPRGVLCTNADPAGRTRVIDLFPESMPRLFPVGRLDEDSEGLLVVTNDGDFAHKLAHPRHRIYRTYKVQVAGDPPRETLDQLKKGFHFADGRFKVHDVKPLRKQGKSTFLELVLTEGQNREIRRLMARIGHKVITLQRVAFGPLYLGKTKPGEFRELRADEVERFEAMVARNLSTPTPKRRPDSNPAFNQSAPDRSPSPSDP